MRWYHWLAVPLIVTLVVLAYVFGRREHGLTDAVAMEIDALEATANAKRIEAQDGADKARSWVEERYHAKLSRLDIEAAAKAESLRNDPCALAEFLARLSG